MNNLFQPINKPALELLEEYCFTSICPSVRPLIRPSTLLSDVDAAMAIDFTLLSHHDVWLVEILPIAQNPRDIHHIHTKLYSLLFRNFSFRYQWYKFPFKPLKFKTIISDIACKRLFRPVGVCKDVTGKHFLPTTLSRCPEFIQYSLSLVY